MRWTERPSRTSAIGRNCWRLIALLCGLWLPCTALVQAAENPVAATPTYVAPEHVEGATTVDADTAWRLFRSGVTFVDVRLPADYVAGRIPEAYSLTIMRDPEHPEDFFQRNRLLKIAGATDAPIVIYCNERNCWRSEAAITRAREWGFTNLYFFPGGYPEWIARGYPFE